MAVNLFYSNDNSVEITRLLLMALGVKVTRKTMEKDLLNHPDYPSLLSISDILAGYGVANVSFKTGADRLEEIPAPFIVVMPGKDGHKESFTVIESVTGNYVSFYDTERHSFERVHKEAFAERWPSGIILIAEAGYEAGEKDYLSNRREEKRWIAGQYAMFLVLPILAIISGIYAFLDYRSAALYPVLFTVFTLAGSIVSGLLLWYEVDQYNPMLQQICSASPKASCGAVLQSKASKIWGVRWSVIGFAYFTGGLLLLLTVLIDPRVFFILAWSNALAAPYMFFSIYYQWRIVKQWCVLCLCVQGLLLLQLIIALIAGWHTAASISEVRVVGVLLPLALAYLIPFVIVNLLLPSYNAAKEGKRSKVELQRLKHDPEIFNALLAKQRSLAEMPEGLGILLGNPEAVNKIIKVCNPYCGPCANAHKPMEELLHGNPDLQVQILFTVTNAGDDVRMPPVRHLLAIAEKNDETLTKQALSDWYLAEKKDYEAFAAKYPMNGEMKAQGEKIRRMHEWYIKAEIGFTPTFFVNGRQLPQIYSVSDLKYFLSV